MGWTTAMRDPLLALTLKIPLINLHFSKVLRCWLLSTYLERVRLSILKKKEKDQNLCFVSSSEFTGSLYGLGLLYRDGTVVFLTHLLANLRPSCRCLQLSHMHPARLSCLSWSSCSCATMPTLSLLDCKTDHAAPHSSMLWTWCGTVNAPDCSTASSSASLTGHFTDIKHTNSFQFFTRNQQAILGARGVNQPVHVTWLQSQFPFTTPFWDCISFFKSCLCEDAA